MKKVKHSTKKRTNMRTLLAIGTFLFFLIQTGYCQQSVGKPESDSTLIKFVMGIQHVIEKRAADEGYGNIPIWSKYVMIRGTKGGVLIDSLNRYKVSDFKSVTIKFDEPYAIYGAQSPYGIIFLEPKEKADKNTRQTGLLGVSEEKGSTAAIR
jgi:hypothetical protein